MDQVTPISIEAIRAALARILASGPFATAERSRSLLKFVVESSLHQQADRLKEYTLGTEVFGRGTSFDPRIDPIVRAEASRLRTRLDHFYAGEGRKDEVEISLPKGSYVPQFGRREIQPEAADGAPAVERVLLPVREPPQFWATRSVWITVVVLGCLGSFAVGWHFHNEPTSPKPWKVRRLTSDLGFAQDPALSADGKLLAYSSDVETPGALDIYVKQVSGGPPIRLTMDGADNAVSDVSPDGTKIAFHSERDGGGIDLIPTFGGEIHRLVKEGHDPVFSPDGTEIAYWVGAYTVSVTVPGQGEVWIVRTAGGPPRRVATQFTNARRPIWSPDGHHLLVVGYTATKPSVNTAIDWWLIGTEDGSAVRTGLYETLPRVGLKVTDTPATPFSTFPNVPPPGCWLADGDRIIFSTRSGETQNIWETGISQKTGRVTGIFKRLTASAGNEVQPSCAHNDTIAFTSYEPTHEIWSTVFDLKAAQPKGEMQKLEPSPTSQEPSLSGNGRFLAYTSPEGGPLNIWLRDLESGKESHLSASATAQRFSLINESGNRIAYAGLDDGRRTVHVWSPESGSTKICDDCLRPTDWSRDEKSLVVIGSGNGGPFTLDVVDVASHERTTLLRHPAYSLLHGKLSPDERWISFTARTKPNQAQIIIAPLTGKKPVPENTWIVIADVRPEERASWSPDGKMLYFSSSRDGHSCLWAQRLNAVTHRPSGEPFAVQHYHGRLAYQQGGWAAKGGRIAVGLSGGTGNVWMMSRDAAP